MGIDRTLRHEVKLTLRGPERHKMLAWLRLDPIGLTTAYEPRMVQSIYFDSFEGRALEENLAGISRRRKLRFRWYGGQSRRVFGALEAKHRQAGLGWKHTWQIEKPLDLAGTSISAFRPELEARLPLEARRELTGDLLPAQWIRYQRCYLAAGAFRVTVDSDLAAIDLRWRTEFDDRFGTAMPDLLIVEVKCGPEDEKRLEAFLARMPVRRDRCSKFVLANIPEEGPEPSSFDARGGR